MKFDLVVIGGGAAGFFGAIQVASMKPASKILILEKSSKLLSKVRVSGGGRCNVTHSCFNPSELSQHYPRGAKQLKTLFRSFHAKHVVDWFSSKKVILKTEADGRMFPITDSSETIIECFMAEAKRFGVEIQVNAGVTAITREGESFTVETAKGTKLETRKILIATGGNVNHSFYKWIVDLGHTLVKPIPSLFTFNDQDKAFIDLMGISAPEAEVKIAGTKFSERGPVLITHWGLSGPAVIKLSAWAAEYLHEINYEFVVLVNWIGSMKEEQLRVHFAEIRKARGKQTIMANPLFNLPYRLWQRLCQLSEIGESKIWNEVAQKNLNKLLEHIIRCPFKIRGKTTFKEEFVTCGGIDLREINVDTMESTLVKNIFFAGEVLNIDGETGGFNFQAAWTTAYVAAQSIVR